MSPAAKTFVSPRRPNWSISIVPRSFLNSAGSHASDACWPTAMMTLSTGNFVPAESRSIAIGEALMAPVNRAGCSCSASTFPLPTTDVIARPCIRSTPSSSMSCRSSGTHGISFCPPSTVIIVTSCAPCRNASRAQSMAVLPPPMTATRGPRVTFDVPMPMSRRKGSPNRTPSLSSPCARALFGSVRPTARTTAS